MGPYGASLVAGTRSRRVRGRGLRRRNTGGTGPRHDATGQGGLDTAASFVSGLRG